MESALAWVGQIAAWIGMWIPRWTIIPTTHAAVKFVRGHTPVACEPGIHWYWPVLTSLVTHPTARQSANLKSQTIMTTDSRSIIVSGLIVFEIKDIVKILAHTWDPDETVADICLGAIHDVCSQLSWDQIREQQRSGLLDKAMKEETRKSLDYYGVRVIRMTLTDLAPVKVLKLVQATTTD